MKQVWITRKGPPEVLQVREAPDPNAGSGEVRVRVKAAGINFADLSARLGVYPDAPPIPCVVGYEVSGVVDQVGADVEGLREGDRVFAMPRFGGYTDTLVVPAGQAIGMPDAMGFEDGAALPVAYLTAHHMMLFTGHLRKGSTVLIHSAAGGVGLAALQLAKTRGCIILGSASPSKHAFIKEQGCQHPLDSSLEGPALMDAVKQILQSLGGHTHEGLDLVLDPVGGRSWKDGYTMLGPTGRLVAFGFSSIATGKSFKPLHALRRLSQMKRWGPMALMDANKTISGVNMGHLFHRLDLLRPQFQDLVEMYTREEIKPHVDRTFTFEEAPQAHHHIHDRKAKGKVLLVPGTT